MTSFTDYIKYQYWLNQIFYIQITENLGNDVLYRYCSFNGILEKMISAIYIDDISIYDFDGFSSLFFHTSTSISTDLQL